jgi:hypothetical protein
MTYRLTKFGLGTLLAALLCESFCSIQVQAQGVQSSKRDFSASETNAVEIFKSLNQLGDRDEGLKKLQDELSKKGLLSISRQNPEDTSLAGTAPLAIPTAQPRRKKDDWNQSDSWLSNPGQTGSGSPMEDIYSFSGSDNGKIDKRKSSWDPILQKLRQDEFGGVGLGSTVKAAARQPDDSQDDSDLPQGIKESADKLKKLLGNDFGANLFAPTTSRGSVKDFFGTRQTSVSVEDNRSRQAYMDSYATILFGESSAAAVLKSMGTLGSPVSASAIRAPAANPLATLPGTTPTDPFRPSTVLNGTISAPTLPNLNANVLNQWNPMYTQPKPEAPKAQPFFTPPVEAPRRRFF